MKRKFFSVLFALVLVLSMSIVMAPPALAATAITDVWVEFPSTDETGVIDGTLYFNKEQSLLLWRIHFTPTTALKRGVDTIVVQFYDGLDSDMGPTETQDNFDVEFGGAVGTASHYDVDPDGPGTTYGYYDCQTVSQAGYRVTATTPVDLAAGQEAWLLIDDHGAGMITSGYTNNTAPNTAAYKVKVYTSQDTTPVLSHGFYHGTSQVTFSSVSVSPNTAGSSGQYTFTFTTTSGSLAANTDTITVTFPYGTTVPSSISASNIIVYSGAGQDSTEYTCGADAVVDTDLRTAKVTVPHITSGAGCYVKFATAAGITNPTYGKDDYGENDLAATTRIAFIRTNDQQQDVALADAAGYEITEKTATTLDFDYTAAPYSVTGLSDKYTMINMYSSILYLQVEDQYGNLCNTGDTAAAQVTLRSSSGSGTFSYQSGAAYIQITDTVTLSGGAKPIYYRDSAAGTHTLTASYTGLTDATQTMSVCPGASLYDRYDNLIHTYAPTTSTPAQETDISQGGSVDWDVYKGGKYLQLAINAATTYDVIVLGDGHYEVDNSTNRVNFSQSYLTIKSLNGADYTTIDGSGQTTDTGTSQTINSSGSNLTFDGLTITNLPTGNHQNRGIYLRRGAFTVQNCKFVNVPGECIMLEANAAVTSGTITNNTFTGMGPASARYGIWLQPMANNAVSGVSVTNNTFTNFTGYRGTAIGLVQLGNTLSEITVSGNTMSNCWRGIRIYGTVTGLTGDYAITENTITDCTVGLSIGEGTIKPRFNFKNNTISGFTLYGIEIAATELDDAATSTAISIQYNDITGTGTWGIYNYSTVTDSGAVPECKYNWWGDATGPSAGTGTYASTTARGSGEAVSKDITFTPWLHKPLADVVADNASYQAVEMKLIAGWNTLSTPVPLISTADSIDELIPSGMTIAYAYDGGWKQINTDNYPTGYVLSPCDAVYVKMSAITYVLLKFDASAFTTPSKDLAAGWNLVSLAYLGYTSTVDGQMNADDGVASVAKTAANLPGYSQVISPSLNAGQTDIYGISGLSWAFAYGETVSDSTATQKMLAGLGYWVYMQNAATLAGFEITPIAPDLN